ncbi:MAG: hypothetical protein K2X11_09660 [Acetobacteraceae bacterium]|nr:hypothetical protein [Acetobacteraceae bacterium]
MKKQALLLALALSAFGVAPASAQPRQVLTCGAAQLTVAYQGGTASTQYRLFASARATGGDVRFRIGLPTTEIFTPDPGAANAIQTVLANEPTRWILIGQLARPTNVQAIAAQIRLSCA